MRRIIRLLFTVTPLLVLTVLMGVPIQTVHATHPTDPWRPYGPHMNQILIPVYADENAEFAAFETGQLDLTDWVVSPSSEASYSTNPNMHLTSPVGEFGMFDFQFNQANTFWGIGFSHGMDPNGVQMRMAFAHLFDKDSFLSDSVVQGRGQKLDNPVPPAQGLGSPITAAWDSLHPGTISAYNLAPDSGGVAAPGSLDFCAARDHMLQVKNSAGAQVFFDANNNCVIDNPPSTQLTFYIRNDHQPRLQMGQALAGAIQSLFGGADVINEQYVSITQVADIVFRTAPGVTDWHIYTGGWNLGAFWDHLYDLYDSKFASSECGGKRSQFAQNYIFLCMPDFDAQVEASIQASSFSSSGAAALNALDIFGRRVGTIPVYSSAGRYVYHSGWTGVVNQLGHGPSNFFTLLDMRPDGSRGDIPAIPGTIRWGFKQGTLRLNIFHSQTLWEFNVLNEIYDTLLVQNPRNAGQLIDWMSNKHQQFLNALPSQLGYARPAGSNTTLRFFLRNNIYFQDGQPLRAQDVKFSILNYRDVPSANLFPLVSLVVDVTVVSPFVVDVHLAGTSIFHELNIGSVPIIPKHIWDADNDGFADFDKISPSYDPLASGTLVGSGPYMCKSITTGTIGGGCSQNADGTPGGQSIGPGGRFLLTKFDLSASNRLIQYVRSTGDWPASNSGNFQVFSWADANNDARIDILDVATIAICFDHAPTGSCAVWNTPFGTDPNKVDIGELAEVATRFEETWVGPFQWTQLNDIDAFTP